MDQLHPSFEHSIKPTRAFSNFKETPIAIVTCKIQHYQRDSRTLQKHGINLSGSKSLSHVADP